MIGKNLDNDLNQLVEKRIGLESFSARPFFELKRIFSGILAHISQQGPKIVIIGGTNGKGETALALDKILTNHGIKTALWTSPHILSLRERFSFDGELIKEKELNEEINYHLEDLKLKNIKLSYYEFLFYVFCHLSYKNRPDVLILEVGLGGRLDTVNLFDCDIAGITSISRDHTEYLGHRYRDILSEKLDVTRKSSLLITTFELEYLRGLSRAYCDVKEVPYLDLFTEGLLTKGQSYRICNFKLAQALAFSILQENCREFSMAKFEKFALKTSFLNESFRPRGRFEKVTLGSSRFIFIGAHNVDGHRKLARELFTHNPSLLDGKSTLLMSFSKRPKWDVLSSVKVYLEAKCNWGPIILANFKHPKSMDMRPVYEGLNKKWKARLEFFDDWKTWIENQKYKDKTILVLGSYYFIGEVQKFMAQDK